MGLLLLLLFDEHNEIIIIIIIVGSIIIIIILFREQRKMKRKNKTKMQLQWLNPWNVKEAAKERWRRLGCKEWDAKTLQDFKIIVKKRWKWMQIVKWSRKWKGAERVGGKVKEKRKRQLRMEVKRRDSQWQRDDRWMKLAQLNWNWTQQIE